MSKVLLCTLALALCVVSTVAFGQSVADYNAIIAHRKANYPVTEWQYIYYIDNTAQQVFEAELKAATAFAIASTSYQEAIEYCTPQPVVGTQDITYIDIRLLLWDYQQFCKVIAKYPYHRQAKYAGCLPLVIRADWLVAELMDTTKSDAHYRLLYNDANLDRDKFLKFWGANTDVNYHYGIAEGHSGVSANSGGPARGRPKRWLINTGASKRNYVWGTLDFFVIDEKTDPVNNPTYPFIERFKKAVHDGEEWIAGNPKYSIRTGEYGALQAYLLANAAGKRIESAPGELVVQRSSHPCRGYASITNAAGCVGCHESGLINSTENEYITLAKLAQRKFYDKNLQLKTDKFNQRSPAMDVRRDSELYAIGVRICNGYTPKDNAANFYATLDRYDEAVTIEQAAWEIGVQTSELQLAMGWHSATVKYDALNLNARFAMLSGGGKIPRFTWEVIYTATNEVYTRWVLANRPKIVRPALPQVLPGY